MRIVFDHDVDANGNVMATYFIDTTDAGVQATLTALKSAVASQVTAGYGVTTKLPLYPGQTRWQAILGEVVRLNDPTARGILGV